MKKIIMIAIMTVAANTALAAGNEASGFGLAGLGAAQVAREVTLEVPGISPAPVDFEMYCGPALRVDFEEARRFSVVVNDAAAASALRAAAAKFFDGERRLVYVTFTGPSSFIVDTLQKKPDGTGYQAGQFGPRLEMLGGGRVRLVLTYFRMTGPQSYEYSEVTSLEFGGCSGQITAGAI